VIRTREKPFAGRSPECCDHHDSNVTGSGDVIYGISFLAYHYGILPKTDETVISQLARLTFGHRGSVTTAPDWDDASVSPCRQQRFAASPISLRSWRADGYMPRQMATFGDRLVFSNGSSFRDLRLFPPDPLSRDTHALIPLYAVGVFILLHVFPSRHGAPMAESRRGLIGRKQLDGERRRRRHDRHCIPSSSPVPSYPRRLDRLLLIIILV